jgi:hypothetical protein
MGRALICLLVLCCFGTSASATPLTFYFSGGSAHVTATAGATLIVDETIDLDGAFVTFDPAVPEVVDFSITAGQSDPISMLTPYGGFDTFVIESANISPGTGYSNFVVSPTGPSTWSVLIGPVDVAGVYSASSSGGAPPAPVMNLPVPFSGAALSFMNGTIDTDLMTFELLGITLAEIPGSDLEFPEGDDLIVKADVTWFGAVPEPSTALLLATGLLGMSAMRKRVAQRVRPQ